MKDLTIQQQLQGWLDNSHRPYHQRYIHIKSGTQKAFVNVLSVKGNKVFFEIRRMGEQGYFQPPFYVGTKEFENIHEFYAFAKNEFLNNKGVRGNDENIQSSSAEGL